MTETEPQNSQTMTANTLEDGKEIGYPDIKSAITLFFIFILYSIIVAIPGVILMMSLDVVIHNSPLLRSFVNLLIYLVTLLITIKYTIKKSKEKQGYYQTVSLKKIQVWLIPTIIVSSLALFVLLEQSASWIPMPDSIRKFFEGAFRKDIFSIITIVIAAPILEEILCRGIVLRGLLKNYPPYKAILISALFFGLMHLDPWQAIPAFFGGLFLGWVYYKTQSVIPGIIIHATINSTAAVFLFLPGPCQDLLSLWGFHYYLVACLICIVIFTGACVIIHKKVVVVQETGD
jgi:membrane protease YdiL (CAAX protease family)